MANNSSSNSSSSSSSSSNNNNNNKSNDGDNSHLVVAADHTLRFNGGKREMLTGARTKELLSSLLSSLSYASIEAIRLGGQSVGEEAAIELASHLTQMLHLHVVDLGDIIAGRPEEEALKALEKLSLALKGQKLVEIDLSDNALGAKGIQACRAILAEQESLERLFLNNNGLAPEAGQLMAKLLLFRGIEKPTNLRVLHAVNNLLCDGGAVALKDVLAHSPALMDVRFSATRFTSRGGLAIAVGLQGTECLERIDLSDNDFAGEAGSELAKMLKKQTRLRVLNLNYTSLKDKGAKAVAVALSSPNAQKLEIVQLCGNEITSKGAIAVAEALNGKKSLKSLELNENQFSENGIRAVKDILRRDGMLDTLGTLSDNEEEEEEGEEAAGSGDDDNEEEKENKEANSEDEDEDEDEDEEKEEEEEKKANASQPQTEQQQRKEEEDLAKAIASLSLE